MVVLTGQLLLHLRHLHQLTLRNQPRQLAHHRHVLGHGARHLLELRVVVDKRLRRKTSGQRHSWKRSDDASMSWFDFQTLSLTLSIYITEKRLGSSCLTFMSEMDSSLWCPLGLFFWKSSIRFLMLVPISPKFRYRF